MDGSQIGLTTAIALEQLHTDLHAVLNEKDWAHKERSWRTILDPGCPHTMIGWPSMVVAAIAAVLLLCISTVDDSLSPLVGLSVIPLLGLGLITVFWDSKLRNEELFKRAASLVNSIRKLKDDVKWTEDDYHHISSPPSPCITLQWVYRDGTVVNLPWALLVKGDVIVVRPGQTILGYCTPYDDQNEPTLHASDIYNPSKTKDSTALPAARNPLDNKLYLLHETPYASSLRLALLEALSRPTTFHDKERHLVMGKCVEQNAMPLVTLLAVVINIVRYMHLRDWHVNVPWWQLIVLEPILCALPLMPLAFPIFWRLGSAWGVTKLRAILQDTASIQIGQDPFEDDVSKGVDASNVKYRESWQFFLEELMGNSALLCRSSNVVHVLGSVTALCCVDKKGILCWPNPTAEKVFFLNRSSGSHSQSSSQENLDAVKTEEKDPLNSTASSGEEAVPEVLDLTHDHATPFRLQFDDPSWKNHISSLKPLGLAILLNTCNQLSHEVYSQFCCHLACEASHNEGLAPVTNRRCLCELAAQIGFTEQAQDAFTLEQMLCTFQHVKPEAVKRDIKFARQLSKSTKLKFPFPHMVATVLRDKQTSCLQLMTQGTADVILDSCVEYWDGQNLQPLSASDRKKILDFYQRTSLTANCTAFAYRPLSKLLNPKLANSYLEVPSDSRHLYLPFRSPTPLALSLFDAKWRGVLAQFHSSDSLLGIDGKEEEITDLNGWFELQCNQIFLGMITMQYQAQPDVVHLVEQLERACIRFVHFSKENELRSRVFSEKMGLESGWNCHISLFNDKRSEGAQSKPDISDDPEAGRIEKLQRALDTALQLDLITERTNLLSSRTISMSAPSAINTDQNTVKFDDAVLNWDDGPPAAALSHRERRVSEDSLIESIEEAWRSMSNLTNSSDQSVPFAFDMSNRAKLPRGIDQIRPHLEVIDNVPLLVSLFTDCTPTVTKEMIRIMQDYGEVVCIIGSSANYENISVFLQADASIAMEPLYPQVCQKQPTTIPRTDGPSPIDISRALNSLPCCISLRREDPLSMYHLIASARHFCLSLRNALQFWLCCVSSVSVLMFIAVCLMVQPPLNAGQILFVCCLIVPILSSSLMTSPMDLKVMGNATGKNQCTIDTEVLSFVVWCYGLKILPSLLFLVLFHVSGLAFYCHDISSVTNGTCSYLYPSAVLDDTWVGWSAHGERILRLQHWTSVILVLHFVFMSASFVHRSCLLWKSVPLKQPIWLGIVLSTLVFQLLYSGPAILLDENDDLPWYLLAPALSSPLLVLLVNETVKWQEIKVNKRFQRRKRLDFGTKLGMNSPF